ncbi:SH3 domain-containing protein 19 isoform X2 [Salmo trutta]|uniref:SH3 domain-containing protein 19 isoform X2 n=1 Tax=Salmo trutta TaxID=8032 RepID=UPI0011322C35|nr:SH3 domain-containing protein 19-like isoform X2 [Salmo trutta]
MAEARRMEDEQQQSLRGEPRGEPVVRRQPPRPTNSSGERSERQKDHRLRNQQYTQKVEQTGEERRQNERERRTVETERRREAEGTLQFGQGPLSSIRAAIKKTTTRATSLSESNPRGRRRPEITILSAEPLVSNTWFPGASGGFPPPPPPAAQIWGSSIPPTIQPPPSYDEVIREKRQEQDQVLPLSSSSSSSPLCSVSTTTIATQTDTGSESSVPTRSHAPVQRGSVATRAPKPPRPSFPFISKPDDTPSRVDDTAGTATATVDPLLFLEDRPALHTNTPTSRHTEDTRPAAFHSDLLTSDPFSPLTFASGSQTDQWVQSSSVPPPHSIVALTTPSSPPLLHNRPRPHPRTKNSLRPIRREVKVQTLVRLGQTESEVTENQEVSYQEGKYLQELLDAFSSDDWGLPDHHSNDNSESDSEEEEEEEEDMSTLRARIQAFEQQQQAEDHGSHGDNGALLGRGRPEPRHRVQAPSKPAPPIAPKPSLATKTACKGVWQGGGSVAIAVNLTADTTTAQPKPSDPSPKPSDPSPKPIKTTLSTPVLAPVPALNPIVPIPAPRPLLPRKPPSEPQRPDRQAGQTEGTPPNPCPPPRPPVAPRTKPSVDLHSTNTRPSVAQKPTAMTSSGRASENRRPSLASKPSIQTLIPAPVQATPPTLAPSPTPNPAPVGSSPPAPVGSSPPAPVGSSPPAPNPAPVRSSPPATNPALVGSSPPAPVGSTPPAPNPAPVRSSPPATNPAPVGSSPPAPNPAPVGSSPPAPVRSTPPALPPAPVRSTPPALPPAPIQRKSPPVSTESEPPLPPRPQGGVKILPLRPPPIKTVPGRPPPPQAVSASSTTLANQQTPPQAVSASSTTLANQQTPPQAVSASSTTLANQQTPPQAVSTSSTALANQQTPPQAVSTSSTTLANQQTPPQAVSASSTTLANQQTPPQAVSASSTTLANQQTPPQAVSASSTTLANQQTPAQAVSAPSAISSNQPSPPQDVSAPSTTSANQQAVPTPSNQPQVQRAPKRGPPLPPRPKPGHPLYKNYMKQDVLVLLEKTDSAHDDCLLGEESGRVQGSHITVTTPLPDQSQPPNDQHNQSDPASDDKSQLKPPSEYKSQSEPPSILPSQTSVEKTQPVTAPVSGPRCVARFDYEGEEEDELTFSEGDVIALTEVIDQEWGRGQIHGRIGIFPLAFTEILEEPPPSAGLQPVVVTTKKTTESSDVPDQWVVALHDFSGQTAEDLWFQQGALIRVTQRVDADWTRGTLDGREGLFPTTFTQTCNTAQPMTGQPVARGVAKVLFDFSGESEDELSLKAGEVVTGVVTVDEEWYLGDAGGRRGLVPKNYLKLLPDSCK